MTSSSLPPVSAPVLTPERLAGSYSYAAYRQLLDELLAQGKTTGPNQSEALTAYARLNQQRMQRLEKQTVVQPDLQAAVLKLTRPYHWVILTEGWCGDAAQLLPVLEKVAQVSQGRLQTHYLLRDENPDLMDRYLTNGGRAIPKLIVLDETLAEVAQWGPRPEPARQLFAEAKAAGLTKEQFAEQLHSWYAKDRTRTTQQELLALMQALPR